MSDLILDLIQSKIVIIDLIPRFHHLYVLHIFLASSDTTITVMVSPMMMMIILRVSAVRNSGSRWELVMVRLSMKKPRLRQFIPLPVVLYSFSSIFISDRMVDKSLARGLVSGRW